MNRTGGPGRWARAYRESMLLFAGLLVAGAASAQEAQEAAQPLAAPAQLLTLEEAVAVSLEGNAGLENALWQLEAARAQAREAWGNVMPTVNANASYTRNVDIATNYLPAIIFDPDAEEGELIGVKFGSDNQWFAQARADQPLFNAAAFLGVGAAGRFEELQLEMVRGQAQQVATEARLRYYDVLLAQEQRRLTAKSVERVEQVLDETRKLNEAGLSSAYDVLRLEVELSNLEPNLARAENATESARRALAVTMGRESLEGLELEGSLLTVTLPPLPGVEAVPVAVAGDASTDESTDLMLDRGVVTEALPTPEALSLARERRSDLRQLRLTRELRRTERKVEISQYLPQVSLFATWTVAGQDNQGLDELVFFGRQRYDARTVGLEVTVPIFSGFQRPARVSRLSAVVEQVDAQLALAEDEAENQVETLLDLTRESYERAAAQRRAVGQATRGYDIARREYRAGIGSQLQVTDAELALRQSEFNYAQAVYDYLTAQAQLDAAVGVVPMVDEGDVVARQG